MKNKETSGFEDDNLIKVCFSKDHNPPTMIVIPVSKRYKHVCPQCGKISYIKSSGISF